MESIDPSTVEGWIQGTDDDVSRPNSSPLAGSEWYIVSMKWLNKWRIKNHLKTEDMELDSNDSSPLKVNSPEENKMDLDQNLSKPKAEILDHNDIEAVEEEQAEDELGPVNNQDILEIRENHEPSLDLKENMTLGKDFEILPPKAWNYFKEKYGAEQEIKRFSIQVGKKETKVEITLKPIQVIFYKTKIVNYTPTILHMSIKSNRDDLEKLIRKVAKQRIPGQEEYFHLYLWKCSPEVSVELLKKLFDSHESRIPAKRLKGSDEIQNLEIANDDIILAEIFGIQEKTALTSSLFKTLSESLSPTSRRGLTGLQNLGNTCFMNSGIQCLSNTHMLTDYLLNANYKNEINSKNPIGSKGKIVTAYAELIKEMWNGNSSSVSPWSLKKALGGIASQFMGYSQQDSQEMLSFLIDGIHEDLNQALKLPVTEINEAGLSDDQLAEKWWEKHRNRNSSIIVDLMHGQYRSEVTCVECSRTSKAFDPFLMLNLPVPTKETMFKEFTVIKGSTATTVKYEVPYQCKARDMLKKLPEELKEENCVIAECESYGKEIKKFIGKNESIEKHKDYIVFNYGNLDESMTVILCNFSTKSAHDSYSCGTPLGVSRLFVVQKSTLKDLHFELFKTIITMIEEKNLSKEEVEERFHASFPGLFTDKLEGNLYNICVYNPGRNPCLICGREACYGCKVPYSEESLEKLINRCRESFLLFNIVATGDKTRFASRIGPLKYKKNQSIEEEQRKSNEGSGLTIYDCIRQSEEIEELDEQNTIYCKNCKKHTRGTKKMDIYKLPKHLVIHLKRFKRQGYSCQKNGAQIRFPVDDLVMTTHSGEKVSYDLYAVSNHYGSMGGGHYTAYAKNINGNWYDFNDSSVSNLRDLSNIDSSAAYVLFYKRSNL